MQKRGHRIESSTVQFLSIKRVVRLEISEVFFSRASFVFISFSLMFLFVFSVADILYGSLKVKKTHERATAEKTVRIFAQTRQSIN